MVMTIKISLRTVQCRYAYVLQIFNVTSLAIARSQRGRLYTTLKFVFYFVFFFIRKIVAGSYPHVAPLSTFWTRVRVSHAQDRNECRSLVQHIRSRLIAQPPNGRAGVLRRGFLLPHWATYLVAKVCHRARQGLTFLSRHFNNPLRHLGLGCSV